MDESLYAPWKGNPNGMQSELTTVRSIQRKNLKECRELGDSILNLQILNIKSPIEPNMCKRTLKERHIDEEKKCLKEVENCNNEYNRLLQRETQLVREIDELQKSSKKRALESDALDEELTKKMKIYKEEKYVLNVAKKAYDQAFGTEITVEEGSGDLFTATLSFDAKNQSLPVKFTINRVTNQIIDFDASSFAAEDKLQELKSDFKDTGDTLTLICALRKLAINR